MTTNSEWLWTMGRENPDKLAEWLKAEHANDGNGSGQSNIEWLLSRSGIYRDADYCAFDNMVVKAAEECDLMPDGLKPFWRKHDWLLAPHENCAQDADQRERENMDGCESDSREKLEADASELTADYAASGDVCDALYGGIVGLLDRQASITRREVLTHPDERDEQIAELTAERDALASDLAECDENRIEFRDQRDHAEEMLAQMERERDHWKLHADCWADKCKDAEAERDAYHERAVELEIELAQANGILKNTTHNHAAAKAKYERAQADAARARERQLEAERRYAELLEKPPEGAWAERIAVLEAGNRELREKLSRAIGHAHEIGKLVDLEGRAAS